MCLDVLCVVYRICCTQKRMLHVVRTYSLSSLNLNCATHQSVASLNSFCHCHRHRHLPHPGAGVYGNLQLASVKLDSIYSLLHYSPPWLQPFGAHPACLPALPYGRLLLLTWLLCAILNAHAAALTRTFGHLDVLKSDACLTLPHVPHTA